MARYNSSLASTTITGTHTISSPSQGAFTNLAGTAPYTVTLPIPALFPGSNQTFYNATGGTVTLSTPSGILTGTGGSNASTVSCFAGNVLSVTSDGTNYIVISEDGSALVATTGVFSGDVTMNGSSATVALTPTTVTIAPVNTSNINNMNIGASTRASGAFTSLAANAAVTFTANTASTTTGTGTLVVTGGVGVSGQLTATGVSATNLTGTLQTASQTNVTAIGGSNAIRIDANGNVAVGASIPYAKLWVEKAGIDLTNWTNEDSGNLAHLTVAGSNAYVRLHMGTLNVAPFAGYIQTSYDNTPGAGGTGSSGTNPTLINPKGGQVVIGSTGVFSTSTVPLYVVGGASGWSVFERSNKRIYINPNYSDLNTIAQVTPQASDNMHLSLSSRETVADLYIQASTGNVGINTTDFSAGYTFNVARRARFNGMMLGNGDGSTSSDNRILLDWASGSLAQIVAQQNVPLYLGVGGATKVFVDSAGHWMPVANDSQNLGSASLAWANLYTNDLHLCNETKVNGNDVDGTTGNWTIQEGAENLYIINNKTGRKYAFVLKELE